MNKSLKLLRAAREVLGLAPLSEMAEQVYFDALAPSEDERIVVALRSWLRTSPGMPSPYELRCFIERMPPAMGRSNAQPATQEA